MPKTWKMPREARLMGDLTLGEAYQEGSIPGGPRPRDQALALALNNVASVVVVVVVVYW